MDKLQKKRRKGRIRSEKKSRRWLAAMEKRPAQGHIDSGRFIAHQKEQPWTGPAVLQLETQETQGTQPPTAEESPASMPQTSAEVIADFRATTRSCIRQIWLATALVVLAMYLDVIFEKPRNPAVRHQPVPNVERLPPEASCDCSHLP